LSIKKGTVTQRLHHTSVFSPHIEGVAEDREAGGRPRRMSKDGIGGRAADSQPVARSATRAEARGKHPPSKNIILNCKF
jgi:hypothetical protein